MTADSYQTVCLAIKKSPNPLTDQSLLKYIVLPRSYADAAIR